MTITLLFFAIYMPEYGGMLFPAGSLKYTPRSYK